jgi:histidinol dehydrogenase
MNVIDYSRAGAAAASPTVARFALAEGFDAHAAAATRRHSN